MSRKPDAWLYQGEADFNGHKWIERVQVTTSEQVARWIDKNAHPLFRRTPEDLETLHRAAKILMSFGYCDDAANLREMTGVSDV